MYHLYVFGKKNLTYSALNKKGNRMFTKKDIQSRYNLSFSKRKRIYFEGAKKKLKENKKDTIDNVEIVNKLKEIRVF